MHCMWHRVIVALFIGILPVVTFAQQDPQYSLYMFDKMALNPAAAGSKDALELNLIARNQWLDIPGTPATNALLVSAPLNSKHTGWGAEIMNDRIGPITSSSVQGNYAYNIHLGNGRLAMGIGVGIYDYTVDWAQIDFKNKNDIYAMPGVGSKLTPTAEAGLYYHTTSYYLGLSFNHLIASRLTDITTDSSATFRPHIYFIAGKGFKSHSGIVWSPSVIVQFVQNAPPSLSINLNVLLAEKLWLGVSFKPQYGVVFLAAFKASQVLSIGYAYDLGLNAIGVIGGGAHELSLKLDFASRKSGRVSPRFF
jgi:type IX secretion system PorP/SprF family membrane protein